MIDRRDFMRAAGLAAAGWLLPGAATRVLGAPARPVAPPAPWTPLRVRGVVRVGGVGRAGVAVTDGLTVAATGADGAFELITTSRRPNVYLSLPADADFGNVLKMDRYAAAASTSACIPTRPARPRRPLI